MNTKKKDPMRLAKGRHNKPKVIYLQSGYPKSEELVQKYLTKINCKWLPDIFTERKTKNQYNMPALDRAIEYAADNKADLIAANIGKRLRNMYVISKLLEANARNVRFYSYDITFNKATLMHPESLEAMSLAYRAELSETVSKKMKKMKKVGYIDKHGVKRHSFGLHSEEHLKKAGEGGAKAHKANFTIFATKMKPIISKAEREGHTTLAALAKYLNDNKIPTRYKKNWHPSNVSNLKKKIKELT